MRILMLAQFFPPIIGGEERHVKTLSEALVARGHEVSVATIRHAGQPKHVVENAVGIHRVSGLLQRVPALFNGDGRQHAPPFPDPAITFALRQLMLQHRPDVVHAHNWMLRSYLPLKPFFAAPLVATLHDYSHVCAKKSLIRSGSPCNGPRASRCLKCASEHYGPLKGPVTASTAALMAPIERRLVDRLIAVSTSVAQRIGLDLGRYPVEVIPNFIPDDLSAPLHGFEDYLDQLPAEPFLLFIGDLMRLKGIHVLIEAYRRLSPSVPLVLIGRRCPDTPTQLPPNVRIFESWPHGAVMGAWSRCLAGLLPSVGLEACATVVMEANAVGKPTIVTAAGGLPEIVDDGETGLIVPPGDVDALATAMARLIADEALVGRMSIGARAKAKSLMAHAVVPRIERIYHELTERPSGLAFGHGQRTAGTAADGPVL
jgi:glycosyltransferase involved in cell wall biosynthesis